MSIQRDVLFVVAVTVPFAVLWWLSGRLHHPGFSAALWHWYVTLGGYSGISAFRLFSAESTDTHQEAEYTEERPVDITRALPWLARTLLLVLYLLALWIWIDLNAKGGSAR